MSKANTLDWKKLERFIEERKPVEVSAGILDDWYWTAATVYENGEWDRDSAYVTSTWATPGFKAKMPNGDVIEVVAYVPETPEQEEKRRIKREETHRQVKELAAKLEEERTARAAAGGESK